MLPMQWLFDIVIQQMLNAGFINDWARARIYQTVVQAVPTSAWTQTNLHATNFSNRVTVDLPNNRLIIQDDGYYLILGYVSLMNLGDRKRMHSAIKVNNLWSAYGVTNISRAVTENPAILCATFKYLQKNDFIDLWVYHDQGANRNTQANEYATWLGCHRQS